jgi:hypothetical protein
MATAGVALAAILVVAYRISPNPTIYAFFQNVDRLGMSAASALTGYVFPVDRSARSSAPVFFDIVLIVVTGLQTALIGAFIGLVVNRTKGSPAMQAPH